MVISCLLLHATRRPNGVEAWSETLVSGDSIQLGRGSNCQIHLPDHRVGLLHATINRSVDGSMQIEAEQDALISINGFLEHRAILSPGMLIEIGPYRLTVEPAAENGDLAISVEMAGASDDSAGVSPPAPVTLSALGISKRKIGLGLATFMLVVLLALPMASRVSPAFETWQAGLPLSITQLLSPGPLSTGHRMFGMKCSSCHQHAFQGVADAACTECHQRLSVHVEARAQHVGSLPEVRCIACHPAHQGKAKSMEEGVAQCVACHSKPGIAAADALDFGNNHPPFHLVVPVGKKLVRVRQDGNEIPPEKSGLKFSHQIHLDKEGVSSPEGRTIMTCRDCHKLEKSGGRFVPVKMEMTCQQSRCHRIRFEAPVEGIVPHGSEREVFGQLRNSYANLLADDPEGFSGACALVAQAGNRVRRALDCAQHLAVKHADETLFRQTGDDLKCLLCHEVTKTGSLDVPWKVTPLRLNHDWQPKAVFRHDRHGTLKCTECHDKVNSKTSEDISFPDIKQCRECHAGPLGADRKVKNHCEDCHIHHRVAR